MSSVSDRHYLLYLSLAFYGSPNLISKLLSFYPTFEELTSNLELIHQAKGLTDLQYHLAKKTASSFDIKILEADFAKHAIHWVALSDVDYPPLLKEITNPPAVLFYKGTLAYAQSTCLAVVGPRSPSVYGCDVTRHFTKALCPYFMITSGLALGIDTIAHETCLEQNQPTIAVLGHGLDTCYPKSNTTLFKEIAAHGLLLSEFPLGVPGLPHHFPQRNRLVSGLSQGVLVVEGSFKSGSMITAQLAVEQNREVYAIPHPIFSDTAAGVHALIRSGATLVHSPQDIIHAHDMPLLPFSKPTPETPKASHPILSALQSSDLRIDELIETTQLPVQEVLQFLTLFELEGRIKKHHDRYTYLH